MSLFRALLRIVMLPLAILLLLGLFIKSLVMALFVIRPLRASAEAGEADAQYRYAERCRTGDGVPQDFTQAAFWYRKAAEQGHAEAQNDLGRCYFFGQGLAQD